MNSASNYYWREIIKAHPSASISGSELGVELLITVQAKTLAPFRGGLVWNSAPTHTPFSTYSALYIQLAPCPDWRQMKICVLSMYYKTLAGLKREKLRKPKTSAIKILITKIISQEGHSWTGVQRFCSIICFSKYLVSIEPIFYSWYCADPMLISDGYFFSPTNDRPLSTLHSPFQKFQQLHDNS